jgi:phosphotransferase system HPr (HPr) family protein
MSETLETRTVVVTDPAGVHARTALAIVKTVKRGNSKVTLIKDQMTVEGTEVLQIMTLVAVQGERVQLRAVGPDASAVLDSLEPLFAGVFDDETKGST